MGPKINPLFKLFKIDSTYGQFDKKVEILGWVKGCQWLITSLRLNIELKLKDFPKKGSILVYSNHPTGLDPFILGAAMGREDYVFLGDLYQTKKGKSIANHVIPTVSSGFWKEFLLRRPTNWPGYINMRLTVPAVSKREVFDYNSRAIRKVVDYLAAGRSVAIFPSGGEYEFLSWKVGLSKAILEAGKRRIPLSLYRIKIKKLSELKLIFHFLSAKRLFGGIKVVGYPVAISKDWYKLKPEKLTAILKRIHI